MTVNFEVGVKPGSGGLGYSVYRPDPNEDCKINSTFRTNIPAPVIVPTTKNSDVGLIAGIVVPVGLVASAAVAIVLVLLFGKRNGKGKVKSVPLESIVGLEDK